MVRISISVVRGRSFRSVDGFQVYGDSGSGTVDYDYPLTSRRQLLWDDMPVLVGHMLDGHVMSVHLDGVVTDGHLEGTHLLDEHSYPAATTVFESRPHVFGRFRHTVVMEDAVGNMTTSGVTVHGTVVNSDPPPADAFVPSSHDGGTDQLTFTFGPSDYLVG